MTKEPVKEIIEASSPTEETLTMLESLAAYWESRAVMFEEIAERWEKTEEGRVQRQMDHGIAAGYHGAADDILKAIEDLTTPKSEQPLKVQKAAAKLRVTLDQRLNRVTPEWVKDLSEQ